MPIKEIEQLKEMDFKKQLAFAYLCCERVYPNYFHFSHKYNFGDLGILRVAVDFLHESIFNSIPDSKRIDTFLQAAEVNAPRPDNFDTFYASIAMYSAGVIYESINLLKQTDISRILNDISTMCTDAVDLFIQERDDMDYDEDDFEAKILNDSLMQTELSIQKGSIVYLQKIDQLNEADINTLLQLQKEGTGTLI